MREFTDQQRRHLDDFIDQLTQVQEFFSRLNLVESLNEVDVPEIRNATERLFIRKVLIERLKKNIKILTKGEISAGLLAAHKELSESINVLAIYYDAKLKKLRNVYNEYEQGKLNSKEKIMASLEKITIFLEDFTKNNYFIEELQYEKKEQPSATLTKNQLISLSSRTEMLEINLSQLASPSIENMLDLSAIFNSIKESIKGLEAKCTKTSESLSEIANKWLGHKEVCNWVENTAVQTSISGEIEPKVTSVTSDKVDAQKKTMASAMFFRFFRLIQQVFRSDTPNLTHTPPEEAKQKEIRFSMLRK